ncbi:MAG TPA: phenylalanine--tRNA ligase subunit beta, partial [Chloroflexota bacterium]|nr:phenylalanine--tRNA ligase subunit beta [Chloroflexota bacterium]
MLVIADERRAVGVAGVMGSGDSEVSETTTRILLEAATFNARNVRRTGVALGLRSEASSRFEKGLPRALAPIASARAAALIADLGGGTVRRGFVDAGEPDPPPQQIEFVLDEVERLLGVTWPAERITGNLEALGFASRPLAAGHALVTVPWWRNDVAEAADLVEEVARVSGFDAIPATLLRGRVPQRPASVHQRWYAPARRLLLACGLSEGSSPGLTARHTLELLRPDGATDDWLAQVVAYPAVVREAGAAFQPVRVVNPLTPEREILRITLLPGLLEALRDNLRNGEDRAAFFEIDYCSFVRAGDLPLERRTLAIAMAGERAPRSWASAPAMMDFFDLKGAAEQLLTGLGIGDARFVRGAHPLLHPGRSAWLHLGDTGLGFLGELHPALAERWDLGARRAVVAEFDFEALAGAATETRAFADYPRVPVAKRDLAVVVDQDTPAEEVLRVIRESGKDLIARVVLFDVYQGDQIPEGRKSLACAVELQAGDRTLTDEQIERAMERIRRALTHRLSATFRA